ncbi:uncharacterized protein A4U43_C02F6790 [Asparagus officinalis]|uniref:Dirigent protein n=1 Tax=Asparagus officinalis TaxID=4686 RepID=A0A5P1FHB8_ASPOF|nr:dirigent protein 22-like [Asparagus officinalis]ONK77464.1 uncharacterized protein A4U43_C02F6790 [Asparagus officinalis]
MSKSPLFLLFLFLLLLLNVEAKPANFIKTSPSPSKARLRRKISHLHFYFHDIVSGRNPTAVRITQPVNNSLSIFGMISMMDDPLTQGPSPNSTEVGRAQGMYAGAAQDEVGFLQAMNLCFTAGKYNGSVLTVLGRNAPMHPIREMPVIGGSGLFRFANGYALARTHWFDLNTGDATVEYNVTVMHY